MLHAGSKLAKWSAAISMAVGVIMGIFGSAGMGSYNKGLKAFKHMEKPLVHH
jgi:hypothetical protein